MTPKIDAALTGALADVPAAAARLRRIGFDGCFTFEGPSDPFFPLVAAASSGLDLYTNVAIAFPRSPMHLAYMAADLQRASNGGFTLGLGTQIKPHIENRFSATWGKPVAHMRELLAALRAIFSCWSNGTTLDHRGDYYNLTLMTPVFVPPPFGAPPPLWIGALGPNMTRLAGGAADGLLVHPFHTERFLRERTLPLVEEGAAADGRTGSRCAVGVDVMVGVWRTEQEREAAMRGCRAQVGFYGSTPAYRPTFELHGWGDLQPQLRAMTKSGRWDELGSLISDEMVATIACVGTPTQVAHQLHERYGDVADRIGLQVPYGADESVLAELVTEWRKPT